MVAYSFQRRFVAPVQAGVKRQTIRRPRAGRSRHAVPGGPVTLLTGARFAPELVGRSTCTAIHRVYLDFRLNQVTSWCLAAEEPRHVGSRDDFRRGGELDHFARCDGFDSWDDMKQFWDDMHGVPEFDGTMIVWGDLIK